MERLKSGHGSLRTDKLQEHAGHQKPEFETSEAAGSSSELRFQHQHQQQQVGYHRDHHHHHHHPDQDRPLQTAYRSSGQQQFGMDTIRTTAPPSPQSHYHHHRHIAQHPQHQLLPGHHYFINDLLSATAASSSISAPDLAIASSMQLLNGRSLFSLAQTTTLYSQAVSVFLCVWRQWA